MGTLRRMLREAAGMDSTRMHGTDMRDSMSPDINSREAIGNMTAKGIDTEDDWDALPEHLREPMLTPEECYGPVPPDAEEPYVGQDPFVRGSSPLPTPGIRR